MSMPIPLRCDFDGFKLRRLARTTKDAAQARRLLALAEIYEGGSRGSAARIGSVTLQIVRDWVMRFNAHGPEGLIDHKAPGNRPKLNDEQRQALAAIVEKGPIPAIHGVVRWRRRDLAHWLFEEFRIEVDDTTVGRELKAMGSAKLSARPRHHTQNEFELDIFKKSSRPSWRQSRRSSPKALEIELWWADEVRIGQLNKVTRRWARRGTRPSAPSDQRTMWAYIFGAICPKKGKGAGLVLPYCDTGAMHEHLKEISLAVDPRRSSRSHSRSGWVAHHAEAHRAGQHHVDVPAVQGRRS